MAIGWLTFGEVSRRILDPPALSRPKDTAGRPRSSIVWLACWIAQLSPDGVRHALLGRDVQQDVATAVLLTGDEVVPALEVTDRIGDQRFDRFRLVLVRPLLEIIDREPPGDRRVRVVRTPLGQLLPQERDRNVHRAGTDRRFGTRARQRRGEVV